MTSFLLPADTPRVFRSPFTPRHAVIVMDGKQFEDGLQRIVVSDSTPIGVVADLNQRIKVGEAIDTIRRIIEKAAR